MKDKQVPQGRLSISSQTESLFDKSKTKSSLRHIESISQLAQNGKFGDLKDHLWEVMNCERDSRVLQKQIVNQE